MIVSPDKNGLVDPTARKSLYAFLPDLGIDYVPVSYFPGFIFQPPTTGKYILFDYLEPCGQMPEYDKFWAWTADNPPALTFRRELNQNEATSLLRPLEWPCYLPPEPIQTKAEFDARPIQVLFIWGFSHPSRPLLHAEMFKAMTTHGIEVISSWDELEARQGNFPPRTWVSIHVHHSVRKPIEYVMKWQRQSKITVSCWGNGKKSFRSTEAPVNSIMALPEDNLAWSYPWKHADNCIRLYGDNFFMWLENASDPAHGDLWYYYRNGQESIDKYRSVRYVNEYIVPTIGSSL